MSKPKGKIENPVEPIEPIEPIKQSFVIQKPDPSRQFEKCLVYETVMKQAVNEKGETVEVETKQPVTKQVVDEKGNQISTPITGKDLASKDVTVEVKQSAELGVGCPNNCGRFITLKVAKDLTGYEAPDISSFRTLQDGSHMWICDRCKTRIILK